MTIQKSVTPASLAAQAMGWIDPVTKAVVPPIHMASTYQRDEDNAYRSGRIYARADNPTFDQAETTLAALEGGAKALIFSSGMSAATACFLALTPGDHVVVPKVMYWSLRNWLANFATHWGLKVEFVDGRRAPRIDNYKMLAHTATTQKYISLGFNFPYTPKKMVEDFQMPSCELTS